MPGLDIFYVLDSVEVMGEGLSYHFIIECLSPCFHSMQLTFVHKNEDNKRKMWIF